MGGIQIPERAAKKYLAIIILQNFPAFNLNFTFVIFGNNAV